VVFERLLGTRVPLAGRDSGFELLVPGLVFVLVQPRPQFAELGPREGAQLFLNFLNFAQNNLRSNVSSASRVSDILMW
jgi:hypothetical protein